MEGILDTPASLPETRPTRRGDGGASRDPNRNREVARPPRDVPAPGRLRRRGSAMTEELEPGLVALLDDRGRTTNGDVRAVLDGVARLPDRRSSRRGSIL